MDFAQAIYGTADNMTKQSGAGLQQSLLQGADLAMKVEEHQMNRVKLQQKQEELLNTKIDKFWNIIEQTSKMPPAMRNHVVGTVLPEMRNSLNLQDKLSDSALKSIKFDEVQQRVATLNDMYARKEITNAKRMEILNDPIKLMELPPTAPEAVSNKDDSAAQIREKAAQRETTLEAARIRANAGAARSSEIQERFDANMLNKQLDKFESNIKTVKERYGAAQAAKQLLNSNTPIGDSAIKRQLARLAGEVGAMTDADIKDFGGSRAVIDRMAQTLSMGAEGRLTESNRKEMLKMINDFEVALGKRIDAEADRAVAKAKQFKIPEAQMREAMGVDRLLGDSNPRTFQLGDIKMTADDVKAFELAHPNNPLLPQMKKAVGIK